MTIPPTPPSTLEPLDFSALQSAPCVTCRRKSPFGPSCAAFPEGIPEPILDGSNQHRAPYPGDHGLLYDPDPEGKEVY